MSALTRSTKAAARTPAGAVGLVLLGGLIILAIVGPPIWSGSAETIDVNAAGQGASWNHPFGTDPLGRDVFSRVLAATRISLMLAVSAVAIGSLAGIPYGAVVGVLSTRGQRLVSRSIQFGLTFPPVLVALFLVTIIGPGPTGASAAIGIALAPGFARTAQTLSASIASADYIAAARLLGVPRRRLLRRYILPNTAETLVLQIANALAIALVAIAALSFLGLGVQAPDFDWGRMLAEGLQAIYVTPLPALAPGAAIMLAGLTFGLLGEALARSLNPAAQVATSSHVAEESSTDRFSVGTRAPVRLTDARRNGSPVVVAENLRVRFPRGERSLDVVCGVSIAIRPGERVGLVGESGSGKTMLSLALAGLVPYPGRVEADRLEFEGVDLLKASTRERSTLLSTKLAVVFQDPLSSLNPVIRVGKQVSEKAEVHLGVSRAEGHDLARRLLEEVHIPAAQTRTEQYPHEFSGGMRQRSMVAMGLSTTPGLLIADEPTTALDVTVQAQVLDVLREVNANHQTALLFISHDMAVVTELCSRVLVMYAGRIVESVVVRDLKNRAAHPYTRALLSSVVDLDADRTKPLETIRGRPPAAGVTLPGCPFAPRCPLAVDRCGEEEPPLEALGEQGHEVACWVAQGRESAVGASP